MLETIITIDPLNDCAPQSVPVCEPLDGWTYYDDCNHGVAWVWPEGCSAHRDRVRLNVSYCPTESNTIRYLHIYCGPWS